MPDQVRHDSHKLNAFLNYDTASERVAWIFGHRPKRQKHISALTGALATGCKASGLNGKKPLLVTFRQNIRYSYPSLPENLVHREGVSYNIYNLNRSIKS
jgi:hypothetical protein